jgi:hypothetical protein
LPVDSIAAFKSLCSSVTSWSAVVSGGMATRASCRRMNWMPDSAAISARAPFWSFSDTEVDVVIVE